MYRQCLATMDEDWSITMASANEVMQSVSTEKAPLDLQKPGKQALRRKQKDKVATFARPGIVAPYAYTDRPAMDLPLACVIVFIIITTVIMAAIISCQSRQISKLEERIDRIFLAVVSLK